MKLFIDGGVLQHTQRAFSLSQMDLGEKLGKKWKSLKDFAKKKKNFV